MQRCFSKLNLLQIWDLYVTIVEPGIVTRRPLVLQLHKTEDQGPDYGEFLHLPRKKFYDFCKLMYLFFSFPGVILVQFLEIEDQHSVFVVSLRV